MVIFRLLSHFGLSGHFYLIDILLAYFYFHFMCFCAGFNACFLDFDAVLSLFLSVIFLKRERERERKYNWVSLKVWTIWEELRERKNIIKIYCVKLFLIENNPT